MTCRTSHAGAIVKRTRWLLDGLLDSPLRVISFLMCSLASKIPSRYGWAACWACEGCAQEESL